MMQLRSWRTGRTGRETRHHQSRSIGEWKAKVNGGAHGVGFFLTTHYEYVTAVDTGSGAALVDAVMLPERDPLEASGLDPAGLDRVAVHPHRLCFVAEQSVIAPQHRLPNMLRGTFEMAFRRMVCHDMTLDCRACPLLRQCPYPAVFRPAPPEGSDRLSKAQDLPRPFVFEPPIDARDRLAPGEKLQVGLTLFGRIAGLLPYFVVALRALADRGLGPTRGRLRLESVAADTPAGSHEVYEHSGAVVTPAHEGLRLHQLVRPGDAAARRIGVRFLTPTTLKRDGRLVTEPSFGDLVCRIRDRLSSLAAFYGDGPLNIDFAGVGRAAAAVRTIACRTSWERRTRRSSRTGDVHETSGFTGEAIYEGDLGAWMPLLRLGEAVHVGKYAVWGNGWYRLEGTPAMTACGGATHATRQGRGIR